MDNKNVYYEDTDEYSDDDDDFIVINTGPKSFAEYMELIKRKEAEKNRILAMNNEVPYVTVDMPNGIESGSLEIATMYWRLYGALIYRILMKEGYMTRLFLKNHFYSTMNDVMMSMNKMRNFSQVLYAMTRGTRVLWVKDCKITIPSQIRPHLVKENTTNTNQVDGGFDYIMDSISLSMKNVSI